MTSTSAAARPVPGDGKPAVVGSPRARSIALLASLSVAVVAGIVAAWLTPRGPATTVEALVWMAAALLVGLACGYSLRSRWVLLLAPLAFSLAFELARMGAEGPTVDAVQLGSTYGIIAFVVGRGLTYSLLLPPMLLGSVLGVELAARVGRAGAPRLGVVGWLLVLALAITTIGLAFL
ncbi:MAG TPA: hypothetical protein VK987_00755, partial [Anaerolineae bacterium]|nr:hypothetical protein [Anaerolineae bacterium]